MARFKDLLEKEEPVWNVDNSDKNIYILKSDLGNTNLIKSVLNTRTKDSIIKHDDTISEMDFRKFNSMKDFLLYLDRTNKMKIKLSSNDIKKFKKKGFKKVIFTDSSMIKAHKFIKELYNKSNIKQLNIISSAYVVYDLKTGNIEYIGSGLSETKTIYKSERKSLENAISQYSKISKLDKKEVLYIIEKVKSVIDEAIKRGIRYDTIQSHSGVVGNNVVDVVAKIETYKYYNELCWLNHIMTV